MQYTYDFGLSFAGEDRAHAKNLAELLKAEQIRVFYDFDEQAELWGQDLYQRFQAIYGNECRFFVPFVSANYVAKKWPKHELRQAQARDFKSDIEYILPLRLDDTELPGLNDTTAHVDLRTRSINEVAQLCLRKLVLHDHVRKLYLFLRVSNPHVLTLLETNPQSVVIRVATSRAQWLTNLLSQIDSQICSGVDNMNTYQNGGFGPPGVVPSEDPEPHTTFYLSLRSGFYAAIPA